MIEDGIHQNDEDGEEWAEDESGERNGECHQYEFPKSIFSRNQNTDLWVEIRKKNCLKISNQIKMTSPWHINKNENFHYQVKSLSQKSFDLFVQGRSLFKRLLDENGQLIASFGWGFLTYKYFHSTNDGKTVISLICCIMLYSQTEYNDHPRDPKIVTPKLWPQNCDRCWQVVVIRRWSLAQVLL